MGRVLLVDDEPGIIRSFTRVLRFEGHEVASAESGAQALQLLATQPFDAIISDVSMPGMTGLELLKAIRGLDADVPVILMSGSPTLDSALEAVEYGALRYLTKPVDLRELDAMVNRAVRLRHLARLKREALDVVAKDSNRPGDLSALEKQLGSALSSLWMAFQPIVSWGGRSLFGFEALMRTDEPALKNPALLLDAAERLGSIHELGRTVRNRSAAAFKSAPADAVLFVNLHPLELNDEHLLSLESPLSKIASRVVLEVTERSSLGEVHEARARVQALQALGFRIAVDDLGAGYAGLSHFVQLEPNVVKLDMSLVRSVDQQPTKQSVVRSMVKLCQELGLQVICEGIETTAERDTIAALGCDLMQGYLFAKPGRTFPPPQW